MRPTIWRLALLAAALGSLLVPAAASAVATTKQIEESIGKVVPYVKAAQSEGGEIAGFGGDWALTSLAAVGVAAADVNKAGKEGKDARSWYEGVVGVPTWPGAGATATDYERAALASYAAGTDPARVSKRQNLLAGIASYHQPAEPGYYGATFNATVFGLIAFANLKTTAGVQRVPQVVLDEMVAAVEANQHDDGGWTWEKAAGNPVALAKPSEPDLTGAAIAGLCKAGLTSASAPIVEAREYFEGILEGSTGAFKSEFGNNTNSNAWAVQGLKACGIDPQGTEFQGPAPNKRTPVNFLISQQVSGGGFRYPTSGSTANFYSSQDALRALGAGNFTATPPVPGGGAPQWKGVTQFATGAAETTSLALIVDDGVSALEVCSVTLAPQATTTTLATVLNAAVAGTSPAGCVSGFLPGSGEVPITQVNGYPAVPAEVWDVSIDGAAPVQAKRNTTINVGDTIYLHAE